MSLKTKYDGCAYDVIRIAGHFDVHRRDYDGSTVKHVYIGASVYAECADMDDTFVYTGSPVDPEAFVFPDYRDAMKFAKSVEGTARNACWVPINMFWPG